MDFQNVFQKEVFCLPDPALGYDLPSEGLIWSKIGPKRAKMTCFWPFLSTFGSF